MGRGVIMKVQNEKGEWVDATPIPTPRPSPAPKPRPFTVPEGIRFYVAHIGAVATAIARDGRTLRCIGRNPLETLAALEAWMRWDARR